MSNNQPDNQQPAARLEGASAEIQLAVDLIYLLESNHIPPAVVLAALEIVQRDYLAKLNS